jgi:aminoglycoside phosphotransferase (APT) family kinase protein
MTDRSDSYVDRLYDESALRAYLEPHLGPAETVAVERHAAGHSNETLFLTWDDRDLVLRRPPAGETADRAHEVLREYRVIDALQNTDVPVPSTVLAGEDESVVGTEFYVRERVAGDVLRDGEPERFRTPEARERIGEELVDTLAAIHAVDVDAVGLAEFGYPEGFAERQVRRWSEQLTWAFSKTADEREVPALYDLMEWLGDNAPEAHPHTLVHGDYKLDNVSFGPETPADPSDRRASDSLDSSETPADLSDRQASDSLRSSETPAELRAVFDWEMSTLGDPRTDLGWLLSFWRDPKDPDPAIPDLTSDFVAHPDYPTRRDLVDRWEAATGLTYEHDRFYRALAVYKLCGLGEMFFARHLEGNADDPLYPKMRDGVPALADRATRIAEGEEPL